MINWGTILPGVLGAAAELTKTWKQMFITIAFMGLLSAGLLGYQYASVWITEYKHYADIVDRLHLDEKVQVTLASYMGLLESDRIVIGELHDGKVNMSGIRFGYVSATYEATSPGIARIITDMQNLPTSMFAGYWTDLMSGKCSTLTRSDKRTLTPTLESFMMDNGVKNAIICPIHLPGAKEKIIGISVSMWMDDDNLKDLPEFSQHIRELSLVISGTIMQKG